MAAYREGMKTVLIPKDNVPDLYEVDDEVKKNLTFLPMSDLAQVLNEPLRSSPRAFLPVIRTPPKRQSRWKRPSRLHRKNRSRGLSANQRSKR